MLAVQGDEEIHKLLDKVIISNAGVVTHVNPFLVKNDKTKSNSRERMSPIV
jgi:hypothetical protein